MGAVGTGIPVGACACGAEGRMASIGPPALGAKGCVERLHPTGETTHYDLCVAGAPANHVCCASLRSGGRQLAVRTAMEHPIGALPRTPFPASRDFPSRGNERYEGKKQRVIYFRYHFGVFPLWCLTAPPFPRKRGHYKAPLCCEQLMKGMLRGVLFCPLNRGKSGAAG